MDLDRLARTQHGLLSRAQARAAGLTPKQIGHQVASGRWQRIHRGVYATHSGPLDWMSRATAAVLCAGAGAALTHTSAAYVWGVHREPPVIWVAVPAQRQVVRPPGVRVLRRPRFQVTKRHGIPVTTAGQTVLDLVTAPDASADGVAALVATAVQRRVVTVAQLREGLGTRRTGRALVASALDDVEAGVQSAIEARVRADVLAAHGLPEFVHQAPVGPGERRRRDMENLEFGVIIEADGALWHSGAAFQADRARDREAAACGKVTLRVTWADSVERKCAVAGEVARTLRSRGWVGAPGRCGRRCKLRW